MLIQKTAGNGRYAAYIRTDTQETSSLHLTTAYKALQQS